MKSSALAWPGLLAVVAFALPLVQCSLVTSLNGLTEGEGDAGVPGSGGEWGEDDAAAPAHADATIPAPDAEIPALAEDAGADDATAPTDAPASRPSDGGRSDGTDGSSAGGDAGGGNGGNEGGFPVPSDDAGTDAGDAAVLLFSDDFTGPAALPRAWDTMTTLGGSLALDTSTSVSPSTSWLEATTFALDAGAPGDAVNVTLRKRFPMPAPGATVAYDFSAFVQAYDPNHANVVLAALQVADDSGDLYELQLDGALGSSGNSLAIVFAEYGGMADGGSTYLAHPVTATLATATWAEVRIALTFTQPPLASLYFDGTLALETTVTIPIVGTATQISLGISYASAPTASWVVSYDEAAFWAPP